jgi:acyl-CoA thioester hydrolase
VHEKRIAIRWRDMDAYGHVNNAVYLTYLEEARDEWLTQTVEGVADAWDYVLARVEIDYRRELTQGDVEVVVRCRLDEIGTSSVKTVEELRKRDGELAAEALREVHASAADPHDGELSATLACAIGDLAGHPPHRALDSFGVHHVALPRRTAFDRRSAILPCAPDTRSGRPAWGLTVVTLLDRFEKAFRPHARRPSAAPSLCQRAKRSRQSSTFSTARKASCGISTDPTCFMRFLPSFCFSSSLRLREMSPP